MCACVQFVCLFGGWDHHTSSAEMITGAKCWKKYEKGTDKVGLWVLLSVNTSNSVSVNLCML